MKGLDTNILVRYLTKDNIEQWNKVRNYLDIAKAANETYLVSNIVLCETLWVLKSTYKYKKPELVAVLEGLLEQRRMLVENESTYRAALRQYKEGQGDFSDYLIGQVNLNAGCLETATFDRKLSDAEHFRLL